MSYGFNGTSQEITSTDTTTMIASKANATLAGWVYRPANTDRVQFGWMGASGTRFCIQWDAADCYVVAEGGSGSAPYFSDSGTGWVHLALTYDGSLGTASDRPKAYMRGVLKTLTPLVGWPGTALSASPGSFNVGHMTSPSFWTLNGRYAELAFWDATLTQAEVSSLAKGYKPSRVRPQSLQLYIPLVRDLVEVVSGSPLTNASGTVENHPAIR